MTLEEMLGAEPPKKAPRRRKQPAAPTPVAAVAAPADEVMNLDDLPDTADGIRRECIRQAGIGRAFIESGMLRRPVTQNVLALIFAMDPATVKKRLLAVKPIGAAGGGRPLYDFREAVAYLIEPKMDLGEYIESLSPEDMPNHLNKTFWQARRERLKYLLEAGDSWATPDVLDVFGEVFMTIKDRTQLWTETVRDEGGLNDDQYRRLQELVDDFQADLHEKLIEIPQRRRTRPIVAQDTGDAEGAAG